MGTYKVPQDVEADDKFLGPLTFKQFLFGGGTMVCGYIVFWTLTSGIWPLSILFLIPTLIFGILTFPWSKDQPTELWLASRIRFMIVPRKRVWNQSGVLDLVNITVPKREVHYYTDGLDQTQVKSRLNALATMVDSRGWAVKNVNPSDSDRLVQANVINNDGEKLKAQATTDVMDDNSGIIAQQFNTKIQQSEVKHKSDTLKLVEQARSNVAPIETTGAKQQAPVEKKSTKPVKTSKKDEEFWFMHQQQTPVTPGLSTFQPPTSVNPGAVPVVQAATPADNTSDADNLLKTVHEKQRRDQLQTHSHHEKTIDPNGSKEETKAQAEKTVVTPPTNPDIINLATSNDLNVETIARQANKKDMPDEGEVIISLH